MENVVSPIVSPSVSAKASHNFAHPDVMSLSFCTHVNWIYGLSPKVEAGTGTIPCKPEAEQILKKAESY